MSTHRGDPAQNPLLLLGAFAVVAVLLAGLFTFVNKSADEPTDAGQQVASSPSGSSSAKSGERTPTKQQSQAPTIERGQLIQKKPKPKKPAIITESLEGGSGTGMVFGQIPAVEAPVGETVEDGTVTTSVANIPNRTSSAGFSSSMRTLISAGSDFILLNEVSRRSIEGIQGGAPGYEAYRDPVADRSVGGVQSMNNVVMWRSDRWAMLDGGRVKLVDNDQGFHSGRAFTWDRYATWATLQRRDGAIVSIVSTHMMTNPAKFPRSHGGGESRVSKYGRGMDVMRNLVAALSQHGPVLMGGDMNSHPSQGSWTAAAKMTAAGFRYSKDQGVMYLFYQGAADLVSHRQVRVASDHPAIITTVDLTGLGPS